MTNILLWSPSPWFTEGHALGTLATSQIHIKNEPRAVCLCLLGRHSTTKQQQRVPAARGFDEPIFLLELSAQALAAFSRICLPRTTITGISMTPKPDGQAQRQKGLHHWAMFYNPWG